MYIKIIIKINKREYNPKVTKESKGSYIILKLYSLDQRGHYLKLFVFRDTGIPCISMLGSIGNIARIKLQI